MQKNAVITYSIPKAALDDMNWMRGLAALAVLAGHLRGLFFVDYVDLHHPPAWLKIYYLVTAFGHQAVIVFFILSGFFIGTSVITTLSAARWSWTRFALHRFTRLYVVLVPALILTTFWDALGLSIFGTGGIYGGHLVAPSLDIHNVHENLTPTVFLSNLFFLQHIFTEYYGSDSPLWSLSYEFWSYVIFPLLLCALTRGLPPLRRSVFLVIGVGILIGFGQNMRFYFAIWCLGALLAIFWHARPQQWGHPALTVLATLVFITGLLIGRIRLLHDRQLEDVVVGLSTVFFLWVLLARSTRIALRRKQASWVQYAYWGDVLAGFSYTLYLCHYPLLTFLQAWMVGPNRWQPTPTAILETAFIGLVIVVGYIYPLARFTEARTGSIRRYTRQQFGRIIPIP